MICQRCGQRDATVHLVELVDDQRKSQWLCEVCAGQVSADDEKNPGFPFHERPENGKGEDDTYSLAAFLGQVFETPDDVAHTDLSSCPVCGYTLDQFRRNNRLGCPRCYEAFRGPLFSILNHLQRHVSHLGKAPPSAIAGRTGALARTRVALEKAIAAEEFEKAARLRDEIQHLESSATTERESDR